jgi:hypothetical protein
MEFLIVTILLFISMLIYFRIADKYNIIDKPNHRSAHTQITLREEELFFLLLSLFFLYLILMNSYKTTGHLVWDYWQ